MARARSKLPALVAGGPLAGLAIVLTLGCYNPKIESGALKCGTGFSCPAGFFCAADLTCWEKGTAPTVQPDGGGGRGGTGGTGGTGGVGGTGIGGRGGAGGAPMCYSIPGCMPVTSGGVCDPVCQAGCACGQRCNLAAGSPNVACRPVSPPFARIGDNCEGAVDNCQPGAICLVENQPACASHCYRYCRTDEHCGPSARCVISVDTGGMPSYRACSPPIEPCSPTGAARCNMLRPNWGCYILDARYAELTVCDCAGTIPVGAACAGQHTCQPGNECVSEGGAQVCRKVCVPGAPVGSESGCPPTITCRPFPVSSGVTPRYGWCSR